MSSFAEPQRAARTCACGRPVVAEGKCAECQKKRVRSRTTMSSATSRADLVHDVGRRFGMDFSHVRVRDDAEAQTAAGRIGALAFARGDEIMLGARVGTLPAPLLPGLFAHELAHVAQQRPGRAEGIVPAAHGQLEHEADHAARAYMAGGAPRITGRHHAPVAIVQVEEGEGNLWGFVPSFAKEYVRPAAEQAKQVLDKIVDPKAELPKPVAEAIEVAAVVASVPAPEPPTPAAAPGPAAAPAPAKPKPKPTWRAALAEAKKKALGT